jgi:Protein of unknown function (DUF664)
MVRRASRTAGEKEVLHAALDQARDVMLWKLEGLDDAALRRPMTRSGTNLLGLVKHLTGVEAGQLGGDFGRPLPLPLPWFEDGSAWRGADMWATTEETTEYLVGLYRQACAHADRTIDELDLDDTQSSAEEPTSLRWALIHVLEDTLRHAGHADIVRELIDGSMGWKRDDLFTPDPSDDQQWHEWTEKIADAARHSTDVSTSH